MNVEQLNEKFGIDGQLDFYPGQGGLIYARIQNAYAKAVISTYAGQVLSYCPLSEEKDLLFVSEEAFYETGKAIKGGIPVCWPWFGADPEKRGRGSHGFVRNRQWQVSNSSKLDNGGTLICMTVDISDIAQDVWSYSCELEIRIEIADSLKVSLHTRNTGQQAMPLTQALHTYFLVGDVRKAFVEGLDKVSYIDTIDGYLEKIQEGDVSFNSEVDRIYTQVKQPLSIRDTLLNRRIAISSEGSKSAVVWNPWVDKSRAMSDFRDDEYLDMLCVETANAGPDVILLEPGQRFVLSACYTVSRLD